nr:DUF3114 domain-containing protein [Streptococcus didelphis]
MAKLVDQAFPGDRLSHKGLLERQVHQLRYIISSQQAQYIRQHYKGAKESDGQALVTFLRKKKGPSFWPGSKDYSLGDSARLHNKLKIRDEEVFFPDNQVSYNIKVLVGFHTEFILDSFGNFLNEVDAEVLRENGVVNGASFNYGSRGKRHWDLDVDPVSQHDPLFRDEMTASYRSPKWLRKKWFWQADEEFLFLTSILRAIMPRQDVAVFRMSKG